jgi:hypothetical protein
MECSQQVLGVGEPGDSKELEYGEANRINDIYANMLSKQ